MFNCGSIANSNTKQSIPDSPVNGLHTHRDSEVDLDSHTIDLDQANQSQETSIQLLTPPQTVCESTVTDPAMEARNAAGQVSQPYDSSMRHVV